MLIMLIYEGKKPLHLQSYRGKLGLIGAEYVQSSGLSAARLYSLCCGAGKERTPVCCVHLPKRKYFCAGSFNTAKLNLFLELRS